MNTEVQKVDIGQCRRVKIRCISETSWFDTTQLLADIKNAGGMSASQYAVGWTETNSGGYCAQVEVEALDGTTIRFLLDAGWNPSWMDTCFQREGVDQMLSKGEIEFVFISHEHMDHFWGLPVVLKYRPDIKIITADNGLMIAGMADAGRMALAARWADRVREQLAATAADAQLVVGTHALIQEGVDFARLGLAIVDEQHRFGVAQRLALRKKGSNPHQLMMSATPIPRTLAMSYYADLDVTVLDELPPGRTPIKTRLVADSRRDEVVGFVRKHVEEGRQAYWVCPLIEESEALQLQTAQETYATLLAEFPGLTVGLVHGRLKADEKQAVMAAFAAGDIDVLVATTVTEVGVDVPNASLMVIEHAERFGLSQLHQLRGRVGRGQYKSSCVLIYAGPLGEVARQRLKIIYEYTDGFEIARRDLQLRGPGEFVGSRQSGVPLLRYADLEMDADLVEIARDLAETMLTGYPELAERHLQRWLGSREELLKS